MLASSSFIFSQTKEITQSKNFLQYLRGETPKEGVTFMPGGTHLSSNDYVDVWYVGYNKKSFEFLAFKNSFGDLTVGVLYKRNLLFTNWLSLSYGGGLLLGYNGKLKNHPEIPMSDTFLYSRGINPIFGLDLNLKLSKQIGLKASMASWVLIYGLKYYF